MSHVRGKDHAATGKFAYQCYDWSNNLFRAEGGFGTAQEADRAAEQAEREMTMRQISPTQSATLADILASDDELLAELLA